MSTFEERMEQRRLKRQAERAKEDEDEFKFLSKNVFSKEAKSKVALPKYKVEEKDPSYKMKRGTIMKASSDLHDDKSGKRYITTNMKIYSGLTDKDKASLKKSIMIALEHKFKGGSITDFPKDIVGVVNAIHKHFKGRGIEADGKLDAHDMNRIGSTLAPTAARKIEGSIGGIKKSVMSFKDTMNKLKARADQIKAQKAAQGKGFGTNYLKPKGMRQMIYFDSDSDSDTSSSDDDHLYLPVKRGRGRPRKCQ
jgi:hypothetical protein